MTVLPDCDQVPFQPLVRVWLPVWSYVRVQPLIGSVLRLVSVRSVVKPESQSLVL